MPREHGYFVYILANRSRTFYIGVTNNVLFRVAQHRQGKADSFTARYRIHRLVHVEQFLYVQEAIAREKYLKHCTRSEKVQVIHKVHPAWSDLAEAYFPEYPGQTADPPPSAKDDNKKKSSVSSA